MALTDNLQAFYKLSDTSDSSGNNRTLTNNGNVSFASGKIGNAAHLGPDQTLSANIELLEGPKSCSFWFKRNSSNDGGGYSTYNYVVMGFAQGSPSGLGFTLNDSGSIMEVVSEQTYNDDVWHHVCGVWNGSAIKSFIDGILTPSNEFPYNILSNAAIDAIVIKEELGFARGEVSVDAFGIWNRALSDAEVAELYNSGTGLELDGGNGGGGGGNPTLVKMEAPIKFFGKVKFGV